MWVINPKVGCHYFPPGLQLPPQQFLKRAATNFAAWWTEAQWVWTVCPTASRLRFEPGPFCAWVQHTNHLATEPPITQIVLVKEAVTVNCRSGWLSVTSDAVNSTVVCLCCRCHLRRWRVVVLPVCKPISAALRSYPLQASYLISTVSAMHIFQF